MTLIFRPRYPEDEEAEQREEEEGGREQGGSAEGPGQPEPQPQQKEHTRHRQTGRKEPEALSAGQIEQIVKMLLSLLVR